MSSIELTRAAQTQRLNVADRLTAMAAAMADTVAVACPARRARSGRYRSVTREGRVYATLSFGQLDEQATGLARGLLELGVGPEARIALLVRPGLEFVSLVFALLRSGATLVLIDSGIGLRNLVDCLAAVEPDGFIAMPLAQAVRSLLRRRFPRARLNVTVGRTWFGGGSTFDDLLRAGCTSHAPLPVTRADDPAAIVFTSGSTGPPKGVLYDHQTFATQVEEIQSAYGIEPGGVDLACFPLFGLFNSAMGVTTVLPEMDASRPAAADPRKLLAAANDWRVTQAFASPAVWDKLSRYCSNGGDRIPSLKQVFSCGAPVSADILRRTLAFVHPSAEMHTPYGATECLPVSTIEAAEMLGETAARTAAGEGVCVGRKFDSIQWRIIRISDDPIATVDDAEELPVGEIGELIVRGPQVSRRYVTHTECNADVKIADPAGPWHRMGDVGYLDADGRFWYCGRKSQRVETHHGTLFTECVEGVFNTYPAIQKSALVGLGPAGQETPVLVVEPVESRGLLIGPRRRERLVAELRALGDSQAAAGKVEHYLVRRRLPVDVRHNAKISREQLARWASAKLRGRVECTH